MRETGSYLEDVGIFIFGPMSARELHINTRGWDQTSKIELRTVWFESIIDLSHFGQTDLAPRAIGSRGCLGCYLRAVKSPGY